MTSGVPERGARRFWSIVAALSVGAITSCSADPAPAIMIALNTDMVLPDDISHVGLRITSEDDERLGQIIFEDVRETYDAAEGRYVSFPATLAVLPGERESPRVRIRVVAFRGRFENGIALAEETEAVVLRNIVTTIPADRVALLRIPILFASQGGASGTLANVNAADLGVIRSTCGSQEESNVAGRCVDSAIDASSLPTYTGLTSIDGGACFPVAACFAGPVRIEIDTSDCSAAAPAAESFNLGFERIVPSAESDPEFCIDDGTEARCFVPIAAESEFGWQKSGDRILFAPGVCTQLAEAKADAIAGSSACAPKSIDVSPCGPWNPTKGEVEIIDPDGGLDGAGGGGGAGGGAPTDPRFGEPFQLAEAAPSQLGTLALAPLPGGDVLRVFHGNDALGLERCTPSACSTFGIDGTLDARTGQSIGSRVAAVASGEWVFLADRATDALRINTATLPNATLASVSSMFSGNPPLTPAHAVARSPASAPFLEHVWFAADVDEGAGPQPRLFYMAPGEALATAQGGQSLGSISEPPINLTGARYQAMAGLAIGTQPGLVLASGPYLLRCDVAAPANLFITDPPCDATVADPGWTYTHVARTLPEGSAVAIRTQVATGDYEIVVADFTSPAPQLIASGVGYLAIEEFGLDLANDECFDYALIREQTRAKVRAFRITDRADTVDVIDVDLTAGPNVAFPVSLESTEKGLFVGFAGPGGGGGVRVVPKNFGPTCDLLP